MERSSITISYNTNEQSTRIAKAIKRRSAEIGISTDKLAKVGHIKKNIVLKAMNGLILSRKELKLAVEVLGIDEKGHEVETVSVIRKKRARTKAIRIVSMVQGTSSLEAQGLESFTIRKMIIKTEREFLGPYKKRLWN